MSDRKTLRDIGILLAAALSILFALYIGRLVPNPEPIQPATTEFAFHAEWQTVSPPEDEIVLGYWPDLDAPRAHVCQVVGGRAYEARYDGEPVRLLEESPPVMWRALP